MSRRHVYTGGSAVCSGRPFRAALSLVARTFTGLVQVSKVCSSGVIFCLDLPSDGIGSPSLPSMSSIISIIAWDAKAACTACQLHGRKQSDNTFALFNLASLLFPSAQEKQNLLGVQSVPKDCLHHGAPCSGKQMAKSLQENYGILLNRPDPSHSAGFWWSSQ